MSVTVSEEERLHLERFLPMVHPFMTFAPLLQNNRI